MGLYLGKNKIAGNVIHEIEETDPLFSASPSANITQKDIDRWNETSFESDSYATKSEIPTKISQLTNDSEYLTEIPSEYVTDSELASKGYLTEHQDLSAYATKGEIPTKTSQLTNDSGFLTEHQDLTNYATKNELHNHSNKEILDTITQENIDKWNSGTGGGSVIGENLEIIALKSAETLNISTNGVYEYFKMETISQLGNNFLLEDGNLKIGKGISKILISFTASLSWVATASNKYVRVERDGQALAMSKKYVETNSTVADIIGMTPVMIDVKEGDILKLGAYGTKDDNYVKGQVYLTVQKINETNVIAGGSGENVVGEENNMLTASLTEAVTIAETNVAQKITSFVETTKVGDKFYVENGVLKIGAGVSKIKLSYSAAAQSTSSSTRVFTYILKNDSPISQESYYFSTTSQQVGNSIPPVILDVQEGDEFTLRCYGPAGNKILGNANFKYQTHMTIEEYHDTTIITGGSDGDITPTDFNTKWVNAELTEHFKLYNDSSYCRYAKIGNMVNIQFVLSPVSANNVLNSATETTAFKLPEEYRPSQNLNVLCQGSGTNIFNVGVNVSGNVNIYRYRNDASYSSTPPSTTAWLPCNISYFVDSGEMLIGNGGNVVSESNEIINVGLSTNLNHTVATSWVRKTIPFDKVIGNIGDGFTLTEDGRIKIGAGISKISINAGVLIARTNQIGTVDTCIRLIRNGEYTNISSAYFYISVKNDYQTINNIKPMVEVQENDEIEMNFTSPIVDEFKLSNLGTFLSIEKLNETNVIAGGSGGSLEIETIEVPLEEGIGENGQTVENFISIQKCGNMCILHILGGYPIKLESGKQLVVATIPEGYRPIKAFGEQVTMKRWDYNEYYSGAVVVTDNGIVKLEQWSGKDVVLSQVIGQFAYYVDEPMPIGGGSVTSDILYYKSGDTYKIQGDDVASRITVGGSITSSRGQVRFGIFTPKFLTNITNITVNYAKLAIRHTIGGYLLQEIEVTDKVLALKNGDNAVYLVYNHGEAFTSATNNTPVSVEILGLTLTLN